ncbi:MAG: hypothetical protein ACLQVL_28985 [Terriglobia bacterium]
MVSIRSICLALAIGMMLTSAHARAQAPICYASPEGNDLNDGSYWAFAKADIMACYDSLPSEGGIIYVRDAHAKAIPACKVTDPPGCGIWLMNSFDPNYSHPLPGWRKFKPIHIVGVGGDVNAAGNHSAQVAVSAGGSDTNHPAIWISTNGSSMIENLNFGMTCLPAKLGYFSNGEASGVGFWEGYLVNDYFNVTKRAGCGPAMAIGGESAWDFIQDSQFSGNPAETATVASIARSANIVTVKATASLPSSWAGESPLTLGVVSVADPSFDGGNFTARINGPTTFTYMQNGPDATSVLSITRVAESSGNVVTLNYSTTGNAFQLPQSGSIGLDRLTRAIWLNRRTVNFSLSTPGTLTFTDPARHGSLAGTAETGTAALGGGLVSSDQAQAIVMHPQVAAGDGLIFVQNAFFVEGGIKVYPGKGNGSGIFAENILQEAGRAPIVWFPACVAPTFGNLKNLSVADPYGTFAGVRVDCGQPFANLITVQQSTVDGPATLLGGAAPSNFAQSPLLNGQQGIFNGYLLGQNNAARRGFGPVNSRFTNLISMAEPFKCGGPLTCIAGSAPDGTNNATLITSKSSAGFNLYLNVSQEISAGDIFIYGAWVKTLTPPGFFSNASTPLSFSFVNIRETNGWAVSRGSAQVANGEWDWAWGAFKVSSASAPTGEFVFSSNVGTNGTGIYAPVLIRIPSGTLSDNEAIEYAETLQAFRHDATPGQISLLPGEQLKADSIQVGDGPSITSGLGPPKGSAPTGSIYLRRDGTPGCTFYIYEKDGWKTEF